MIIKEGDRLFQVLPGNRTSEKPRTGWIIVSKVGRKWATFLDERYPQHAHMGGRFDNETMQIDGGFSSVGTVYQSEEDWHKAREAARLWRQFQHKVANTYGVPSGAGQMEILRAADLLGIKLEEVE